MVEKCFNKGETLRGSKILVHLLRMYYLANQFASNGRPQDLQVANRHHIEIQDEPLTAYDQVQTRFGGLLSSLQHQLKVNCFGQ